MDDFGSRSTSLQTVSTPLPSKELSDVIVKAFDTAFTQFNTQNNIQTNNISGNLTGGLADTSIADYYKNLLRQSLEKEEKQKKKDAENEQKKKDAQRKQELAEYQKNAQAALNEFSKWANNPLQGVSDLIDTGFKKMFVGIESAWNTPVSEVKNNIGKVAGGFVNVAAGVTGFIKTVTDKEEEIKEVDMDSLIEDAVDGAVAQQTGSEGGRKSVAVSKEQSDRVAQTERENQQQSADNTAAVVAATNGVGLTVGGLFTQYVLPIALGIGILAAAAPVLITKIFESVVNLSRFTIPELKANIPFMLQNAFIEFETWLNSLLSRIPILGYDPEDAWDDQMKELDVKKEKAGTIKHHAQQELDLMNRDDFINQYGSERGLVEYERKRAELNQKIAEADAQIENIDAQRLDIQKEIAAAKASGMSTSEIIQMQGEKKKERLAEEHKGKLVDMYAGAASQSAYAYEEASRRAKNAGLSIEFQEKTSDLDLQELQKKNTWMENKIQQGHKYMDAWGSFTNNLQYNVYGGGSKSAVAAK